MTTAIRPALDRPTGSMRVIAAPAAPAVPATVAAIDRSGNAVERTAADRRLAALVDELAHRDEVARAEQEARRPVVWLTAMTVGAVALAPLAVLVMVAPPL